MSGVVFAEDISPSTQVRVHGRRLQERALALGFAPSDNSRPGLPREDAAIVDQGQRRPLVDELVGPPMELRVVRVVRVCCRHSRSTVHAEPHVVLAHAIAIAAARPAVAVGPEASADPSVEEVAGTARRSVRRRAGRLEVQAAGVRQEVEDFFGEEPSTCGG